MSNRRRLKTADPAAERCSGCGRKTGAKAGALRLRTGQVVCPRCREHAGPRRAGCGHVVLPGEFTVRGAGGDSSDRCARCAPEAAAAAGNMRLGLAPRKD